jgi:hypothetical protein
VELAQREQEIEELVETRGRLRTRGLCDGHQVAVAV